MESIVRSIYVYKDTCQVMCLWSISLDKGPYNQISTYTTVHDSVVWYYIYILIECKFLCERDTCIVVSFIILEINRYNIY